MTVERPRENSHREIAAILKNRGGGVAETRDGAAKYTVVVRNAAPRSRTG